MVTSFNETTGDVRSCTFPSVFRSVYFSSARRGEVSEYASCFGRTFSLDQCSVPSPICGTSFVTARTKDAYVGQAFLVFSFRSSSLITQQSINATLLSLYLSIPLTGYEPGF